MVQEGAADVQVAAASSLPGPWLSPRSRSMQARANMERKKRRSFPPTSSSGDSSLSSNQDKAPERRPISLGLAPGMGVGIKSNLVSEVLPEVSFLILEHLDCEGLRKLSAVCKSLRARSFRQLALAEFTPKSVMLTGLFQTFHVDALRMGRRSGLNGRTALHASIVDAMSMSDASTDVAYLDKQSQSHTSEDACGAGILLPGEQWRKLQESLSVREHRLVNMEGALKKRVLCSFRASKRHRSGIGATSGRCSHCLRYGCITCGDIVNCKGCGKGSCIPCQPTSKCSACMLDYCGECWGVYRASDELCMSCPRSTDLCGSCVGQPHCEACGEHCGGTRTCETCRGISCTNCAEQSSTCKKCGQFTLW